MPTKENYKKYKEQRKQNMKKTHKEWVKNNREQAREIVKKYKNSEKGKKHIKEYREKNKERIDKKTREWKEENKAGIKQYAKEYQKNHLKEFNVYWHKRRSIIKGLKKHFTIKEWNELQEKWNYKCLCCGEKATSPDHITPLLRGGSNEIDNIQPLCLPCNLRKNSKIIDYRLVK